MTALIVASTLFMEMFDATVLATALPTIAHDFGVRVPEVSMALISYLLALAIFIPASGYLADRFGTRTVFRASILLFMLGSVACSFARTLELMVVARFVQGIGGALSLPTGRLVLLRSVAKKDLVNAQSWLLVPALIGPLLGPPVGGFVVTYLNWRWIFYINLPMGCLGLLLVGRYIPNHRLESPARFDLPGFMLSGAALGCLLFGFEMVSRSGQGTLAAILIAVGVICAWCYIQHARHRPDPILDLTLLKSDTFRIAVIAGSLARITQGAQPFLLPLMMQLGFGFSAARSGSLTLATVAGALLMKGIAGPILRRFGFRKSLIWGGVLGILGYALCGLFRPGWPDWAMFAVMAASGFVMSYQFTAYNTVAYDEIEPQKMSRATAFYTTFQQLTLSLGICVAAITLHSAMLLGGRPAPSLADFSVAFWVVSGISLTALAWNRRFHPKVGAEISGHRAPAEF